MRRPARSPQVTDGVADGGDLERTPSMARAIGIDLGTTNSLVAHVDSLNRPQVIPVDEGGPLLASAVYYGMDGSIEVGAAAKRRAPERPVDTILSVKRF